MNDRFGYYPQFYVKRKDILFPLIEKYLGKSLSGMTHGDAIQAYLDLLSSVPAFKSEVDIYILQQNYKNAIDPITRLEDMIGGIFKGIGSVASSNAARDTAFASVVLEEQSAQNKQTTIITVTIVVISLGIVGLGIYMAVKKKK